MATLTRLTGAVLVTAALSCTQLEAAPITFYSGDGGDLVNGLAAVTITAHPAWGDVSPYMGLAPWTARWISFADTGVDGSIAPDAPNRNLGNQTAVFSRTFDVMNGGFFSLWVLADDTATVTLTGSNGYYSTLLSAYMGQVDPCAPGGTGAGLGCVLADMGHVTVANLAAGTYTMAINAFQTNGLTFGAQYVGQYSPAPPPVPELTPVPEPASLLLMTAGMGAVAVHRRLRKRRGTRVA
jgi:hypothetical protein